MQIDELNDDVIKFYCLGVPRSGTTYFAHLINAHPNAFCGMESFPPHKFRSEFLHRDRFLENIRNQSSYKYCSKALNEKLDLSAIGDKWPRAYLQFERVVQEMSGGKMFVILREPIEIFHSWEQRANDSNDHWDAGRGWLVAYIELIWLIQSLVFRGSTCVNLINYRYLVDPHNRFDAAYKIMNCLNLEKNKTVAEFCSRTIGKTLASMEKQRPISESQSLVLGLTHMKQFNENLLQDLEFESLAGASASLKKVLNQFLLDSKIEKENIRRAVKLYLKTNDRKQFLRGYIKSHSALMGEGPLQALCEIINEEVG